MLGVHLGADERDVRRAYASCLRLTNPEDDEEGFRDLREAYEAALAMIRSGTRQSFPPPAPGQGPGPAPAPSAPPSPSSPRLDLAGFDANVQGPANPAPPSLDEVIRRIDAFTALVRSECAAPLAVAAFKDILSAPEAGDIRVLGWIESWMGRHLPELPVVYDDVVIEAARVFAWDPFGSAPVRHDMMPVLSRLATIAEVRTIASTGGDLAKAWRTLANAAISPISRLTSSFEQWAPTWRLLHRVDANPELSAYLPSANVDWWRQIGGRIVLVVALVPLATLLVWSMLQGLAGDSIVAFASPDGVLWTSELQAMLGLFAMFLALLAVLIHVHAVRRPPDGWGIAAARRRTGGADRYQAWLCIASLIAIPLLGSLVYWLGDLTSTQVAKRPMGLVAMLMAVVLLWQDRLIGYRHVWWRMPHRGEWVDMAFLAFAFVYLLEVPGYRIVNAAALLGGTLLGWWRAHDLARAAGIRIPQPVAIAVPCIAVPIGTFLLVPRLSGGDDAAAVAVLVAIPIARMTAWFLSAADEGDPVRRWPAPGAFLVGVWMVSMLGVIAITQPFPGMLKVRMTCSWDCRFESNSSRNGRVFKLERVKGQNAVRMFDPLTGETKQIVTPPYR